MASRWKIAAPAIALAAICGLTFFAPAGRKTKVYRTAAQIAGAYRARAARGDARAQYQLGISYFQGHGVPQDYAEAVRWFRQAADQGYARAEYALGFSYAQGNGVPRDYAEAVRWMRQAAAHGDAEAQSSLGYSYAQGLGVPQDDTEAVRWYLQAAGQGDAKGQYGLGYSYAHGKGVPQDYAKAAHWTRQAAERGDAVAQYALGFMYDRGQGVPRNYAEAARWFRKAADQGDAQAKEALRLESGKIQPAPVERWGSVVVVVLALFILVAPQHRFGRVRWVSWALCSALCAAMLVHEGSATMWSGTTRVLVIALPAAGAVVFALMAVLDGFGRRRTKNSAASGTVPAL